ncbi:prolipoprotein diacylglyceryl transferase [Myxococcota bacterium]|nr:prolipoprotein diacylglyceryl transferase [Myxococcota bacterium]
MHPELIPGLPSYGFLILIGFGSGLFVFRRVLQLRGLDVERHTDYILWIFLASLAGTRLFHILFGPVSYSDHPWRVLAVWDGGLSFQGGFLAGAATTYLLRKRLPLRHFLDAGALGLVLGHFWGRIGCVMAGCCWGKSHAHWPGTLNFTDESAVGLHYRAAGLWPTDTALPGLVPVQLYEAVWLLGLFVLGVRLARPATRPGLIFAVYLAGYGLGRFFLEILRGDPGRGQLFSVNSEAFARARELGTETAIFLSVPQAVSLAMLVTGMVLYHRWKHE